MIMLDARNVPILSSDITGYDWIGSRDRPAAEASASSLAGCQGRGVDSTIRCTPIPANPARYSATASAGPANAPGQDDHLIAWPDR